MPHARKRREPRLAGLNLLETGFMPFLNATLQAAPPLAPSPGVGQWIDVAARRPSNDPDRNKINAATGVKKGNQHLGFNFKAARAARQSRPDSQIHQAKAALGVGQIFSNPARNPPAHPTVGLPPQPGNGHGVMHAVADHQCRPGPFRHSEKGGDIGGSVLSVPVHQQGPVESFPRGRRQTCFHGRALSKISGMTNDHRAGVSRLSGGVVP